MALEPYIVKRARIALAPSSDKRAPGLMAPWPPSNFLCQNVLLYVLFKTYFLVTTCVNSFVTVLGCSECVNLFFSTLISCYVRKFLVG
jgi:hypothetical protein